MNDREDLIRQRREAMSHEERQTLAAEQLLTKADIMIKHLAAIEGLLRSQGRGKSSFG